MMGGRDATRAAMATVIPMEVPVPEQVLRGLSKDCSGMLSALEGENPNSTDSIKRLNEFVDPIFETAEIVDGLPASHRAAACNLLCAVIEKCQESGNENWLLAVLDDAIWMRLFQVYIQRSENTKGKSMRQMLLTLTGVLLKSQTERSMELKLHAVLTFIDIICRTRNRGQVKPALQGLAYFLQKDITSLAQLVDLYATNFDQGRCETDSNLGRLTQDIFRIFLSWVVHHDTSLSAGHLIKSFLGSLRKSPLASNDLDTEQQISPLWIEPVVETLNIWQDRMQEFKTHVFPHCFLPNIEEYLRFLSYLHLAKHLHSKEALPVLLYTYDEHANNLSMAEEFAILLGALQTGKELGIIKDVDDQSSAIDIHTNTIHIRESLFDVWVSAPEPDVRLAGLFLSVYSTAVTRTVTAGVLKSLRRHLVHLHTDTDANFRKEVLNHVQRLIERLKGSTATMMKMTTGKTVQPQNRIPFSSRSNSGVDVPSGRPDPLEDSLRFILWYTHFLEWELRPSSSYQRRITALKALAILFRCGLDPNVPYHHLSKSAQGQLHWAHSLHLSNPRLMRLLLDLVLDPFDDIRSASVSILELSLDSIPNDKRASTLSLIPRMISRAEMTMLRTGRADQADGVARAYSLLFRQCGGDLSGFEVADGCQWTKNRILQHLTKQLEDTIDVAQTDLSLAVNGRPVHGTFASLRYIMDQDDFYSTMAVLPTADLQLWKDIHDRILVGFERLWTCIQNVLCADAPEGHVPDEIEEESSLDTKEILSYSWRGLKEASVLLRTIISKAPIGTGNTAVLSSDRFEVLGKLCFVQLVELRHRGAFSTVSLACAAFCRRAIAGDEDRLRQLPQVWYQDTLACIQDKASAITRRSAGIPSLMAGIIAAEQPLGGPLFVQAFQDLVKEASKEGRSTNIEESRLPQVHALNCIKEIFTTSKLSAASETYIGDGLDLAARTIKSHIWPIRNCGLMLFKALIERLLGSDEAQDWKDHNRTKSSRFSYNKYPHLVGILTNLLDPKGPLQGSMTSTTGASPMDLHGTEGVFPALQILRQATPPDPHRQTIKVFVQHLLHSPHWHLRDMAARTLVSLHFPGEYYDAIQSLSGKLGTSAHNYKHGLLLSIKYMLKQYLLSDTSCGPDNINLILSDLRRQESAVVSPCACPFTKGAFLDILNLCDMTTLNQRTLGNAMLFPSTKFSSNTAEAKNTYDRIQGESLSQRAQNLRVMLDRLLNDTSSETAPSPEAHDERVRSLLLSLSVTDPDACCDILESFGKVMRHSLPPQLTISKARLISYIHEMILQDQDEEVLTRCQTIMAESLADKAVHSEYLELLRDSDTLQTAALLQTRCLEGSPANMQSALHLLAFFLDAAFTHLKEPKIEAVRLTVRYIRILRMTIVDTNAFDIRFAALQSVSALHNVWTHRPSSKNSRRLILGLALVLYDMLNDDDDDIRDEAAKVANRMLRTQGHGAELPDAVPIITTQRLGRFLSKRYRDSEDLCKAALLRLTGTACSAALFKGSFAETLAEARQEDTALFVQEKQNLYKDDVEDAYFWAHTLRSVSQGVFKFHASPLTDWVLEGLAALTETALAEVDGPLGWTTKAEVFTLGIRVICAADVALHWESVDAWKVRKALREFVDVGLHKDLHGLWLEKAERVLVDSVLRLLRAVHRGLPAL
ncbi:uncharacterized protein EI97DRAFT_415834 [Westerdykella ornata]|uniref:Uncharacterized protein n=1 Tax=Westerdykella ornata TaxID=318751 RepID=A0A6A6JQ04_WESOR|nr:uncharacterized protein EI97DRAFT_415834 [Westerdykella ornata]KAF2277988.1 hypothetical protein EI97DRAFT_415834 [Westerdykella ornata]